ncbi:MAG: serine/threonine-protein kinase [Planctomycetota bacterium]|nr:serine/threonine-protein kinase [Planctomycetota bacterium]
MTDRGQVPDRGGFRPGQAIDEFTLVAELGSGGMGVVWEAEQGALARRVALKLLNRRGSDDTKWIRRFEREAQACGRLDHPGIVRIHASGEADGIHYMALELVGGGFTLADSLEELRKEPRLPEDYFEGVAALFAKIADALEHAHTQRVLHRDVKPSNILIDEDDQPHVSDFGLARVEGGLELSRTGEFMGTPFYMSPEQAAARRMGLDHRTDVFSLGATLYEALTLARPFAGETSQEVFHKILTVEPRNPSEVHSGVPKDLTVICQKALEKDPDRRFRTMADFAADLRRFLANQPILARPPGALVKLSKWSRRHPRLSTGLGVGALAVLATMAVIGRFQTASGLLSSDPSAEEGSEEGAGGLLGALIELSKERDDEAEQRALAQSASALFAVGDYEQARSVFDSIDPEYARTHADTVLPEFVACLWHTAEREAARELLDQARLWIEELPDADPTALEEAERLLGQE